MGLDAFLANLRYGVASPARYEVMILNPLARGFDTEVCMMCEEAELPGVILATTEMQMYGPTYHLPYMAQYSEIPLTFICSEDLLEKRYFDSWKEMIISVDDHYVAYFDNYCADIVINKLDSMDNIMYSCVLKEAFPATVHPVTLGYANSTQYCKFQVSMKYHSWSSPTEYRLSTPFRSSPSPTDNQGLPSAPTGPDIIHPK